MRRKTNRPLVLTVDEAYQPAACVCLTSAFLNSPDVEFTTYLITDAPNDRLSKAMETLRDTFNRDIKIAVAGSRAMSDFAASLSVGLPLHVSIASFLRLAVHELLPVDSFVYLDCDMVVQVSLEYLLELDFGSNLLAAATDGQDYSIPQRRLGFGSDEPYFNAGTMVVSAKGWREAGGLARIRNIAREPGRDLKMGDQDLINLFCRGRARVLERRWNTLQHHYFVNGWSGFDADTFRGIFHFASSVKPWMRWAPEPARQFYGRYAAVAPMRMAEIEAPRGELDRDGIELLAKAARVRAARHQRK